MFKFLKKIFSQKEVHIPNSQGIQNNHPPLLDGKPNEIVLKQKFHRDSKGRFAKKG